MPQWNGKWSGGRTYRGKDGRTVYWLNRSRNGKRYGIALDVGSQREAEAELALFLRDAAGYEERHEAKRKAEEAKVILAPTLLDQFEEYLRKQAREHRHVRGCRHYLDWWVEQLGNTDLRKVELRDLRRCLKNVETAKRNRIAAYKVFCTFLREELAILPRSDDASLDLHAPPARPEKVVRDKGYSIERIETLYRGMSAWEKGIGAEGSNEDVVQLFWIADDDPESFAQVVRWVEDSWHNLDHLIVFICAAAVEGASGFMDPSSVRYEVGRRPGPELQYARNEAWEAVEGEHRLLHAHVARSWQRATGDARKMPFVGCLQERVCCGNATFVSVLAHSLTRSSRRLDEGVVSVHTAGMSKEYELRTGSQSDSLVQASLRRRKPGDALPSEVVRLLRVRRGLSQDALAYQMGLSGKNVVSGWETGRTACDGAAAELLLRIAGAGTTTFAAEELSAEMHSEWTRAGEAGSPRLWREFMCIFDSDLELDREKWLDLFPALAIPARQCVHGFPFVDRSLAPDVFGIGPKGWSGWINTDRKTPPAYGWILKRDGRFANRERAWEEDPRAVTHGSVLVGSLLELALAGVFLAGRIAKKWEFEKTRRVLLRLNMGGMQGRGIVGQLDDHGNAVDRASRTSNENYLSAEKETSVESLLEHPVDAGLELVAEFAMPLRPDLAQGQSLKVQLDRRKAFDQQQGSIRRLGFLG